VFLGKRERLMKQAWRHGVVGIEDADGEAVSVFYQE
jgi:hypothetical protein